MTLELIKIGKSVINSQVPDKLKNLIGVGLNLTSPVKQPQMAFMWEVSFLDPVTKSNNDVLRYYAKTTAIPTIMHEVIKRHYMGVEYAYASKDISPRTFRCTFYDNQSLEAYRFFYRWKELCNSGEDARMGNPDLYKSIATVNLKDTSDAIVTDQFTMLDCFPTEISEMALTYSSSEEITFDVMFSFSRMQIV
ncbi:hypothetical protein [Alishewanella phage vB_AspM_Slicko01]|nr:hypothetical protein [Alishewanella phage vB_AspM_Slicko01]